MNRLSNRVLGAAAAGVLALAALAATPANAVATGPDNGAIAALSKDIFDRLSPPSGLGAHLSYTGVNPATHRVEIGVDGLTPALSRQLEHRFGADRVTVVPAPVFRTAELRIRKSDSRLRSRAGGGVRPLDAAGNCDGVFCAPTRGGVYLEQDAGDGQHYYACSSTIVGTSRSGAPATLTAGHCFNGAAPVYYGTFSVPDGYPVGAPLGQPGDRMFGGTSDHLVIPWFGPTGTEMRDYLNNCVYIPAVSCAPMSFNASNASIPAGTQVTQRGVTTGRTFGTVKLTSTSAQINTGTALVTINDMVMTTACSLPGDSGGAVFNGNVLIGTISAGNFLPDTGQAPTCATQSFTLVAKAVNAYYNLGFSARLTP